MQAKDARFDGRFFIGVKTTGVYCRPVCPVKTPLAKNVTFYPTAASAAEAGFRPCLRCRPESSPGTPAWAGTSTTVNRALRLIAEGALDTGDVTALSDRLGVTPRHLVRLFTQHLGASPKAVAQTRKLHFAKKLIDETDLPMTEIALSAGYGSVRRFNDHVKQVYSRTPTELRKRKPVDVGDGFSIRLPYRQPYDYDGILQFLAVRATPGVEQVNDGVYERSIRVDGEAGSIRVSHLADQRQLKLDIHLAGSRPLMQVVERVRRLFDLNADPHEIQCCLSRDVRLARLVAKSPGRRVPGTWDPFDVAVRAIVGQQVSVKGATTVLGRIAQEYGQMVDGQLHFPTPESLAGLATEKLSMPRARALAIKAMAQGVWDGEIDLAAHDPNALVEQLCAVKGIGPWTAQYVAMRAINDPDAFLGGDLVLLKVARAKFGIETEKELEALAEAWRPWRAYAGMHLWALAAE